MVRPQHRFPANPPSPTGLSQAFDEPRMPGFKRKWNYILPAVFEPKDSEVQKRRFNAAFPGEFLHAAAHLRIVSQVRVVTSRPKVFSMSVMNTGPRGVGTYTVNTSRPCTARMRAPSTSRGNDSFARGRSRKNVTTRLPSAGRRNAAKGSDASSFSSAATGRTIV